MILNRDLAFPIRARPVEVAASYLREAPGSPVSEGDWKRHRLGRLVAGVTELRVTGQEARRVPAATARLKDPEARFAVSANAV